LEDQGLDVRVVLRCVFKGIGQEAVDWINVTRNRGQWRVPCEQGKELGVP
jgi:hypothetical protein